MCVDDRLREGLDRGAADVVPSDAAGLGAVVSAARRRGAGRRGAAAATAALALALGVGVFVDRGARTTGPPPLPAAATTEPTTPERVSSTDADALLAAAVVGEWTTAVVTPDAASAAMARTGTLAYREPVLTAMPLPGTFTVTFGELTYRARLGGGVQDEGAWYVDDGRLVLVPGCDHCTIVLAPDLHGGALRLALLEDTSPDRDRVPDAAYATVLWTSAAFRHP
jgi:hypothetical protein